MADAKGIRAGESYIELGLNDKALRAGMKAAENRLKAFGFSLTAIGAGIAGLGTAIAAPMFAAAKSFADAGSALYDMSTRTGLAVSALSTLQYAAEQSGTSLESVEGAIRRMQRLIGAGKLGVPAAAAAFAELGISVQALAQLKPEQQFAMIARRIRMIQDPTARASAAMLIFGRSGSGLLPLIQDLDSLSDEAKKFGLVMSGQSAEAADALGDALDGLTASIKRVWFMVGYALAPVLTNFARQAMGVGKVVADWIAANRPLIATIFQVGVAMVAVGTALVTASALFAGVGAVLGTVGTAIAFLMNPITLVVGGLAYLTYWFLTSTETGGKALDWLKGKFTELKDFALGAFGGIMDAMKAGDWDLAAKVLWGALKVAWLTGVKALTDVGTTWGLSVIEGMFALKTSIQSVFIDLWATLKTLWTLGFAGLKMIGQEFVGSFLDSIEPIATILGKSLGIDVGKAVAASRAAVGSPLATGIGAAREASDVEKERESEQEILAKDARHNRMVRARKAARMGKEAGDELTQAQEDLQQLEADAAHEAAATAGKPGGKKTPPPEDLAAGVESAAKKVDVAGTFSAFAAKGLGIGQSIAEDQLKEAKKQTALMEKSVENQEKGGLFFGAD